MERFVEQERGSVADGEPQWPVRVLMFVAPDADARLVKEPTERCLARRGLPACKVIPNDEIAQARRHAIGTEFSVPASTMADAADLAFEVTLCAFAEAGVEFEQLYELTVWPPRP